MIHELVVARARRIGGIHTVLVRAVRPRLAVRRQRVQVDLLGLLCRLVGLCSRHPARDLLKLSIALLHVTLVASGASGGFSRLSYDLLRLLRLAAVVRLPRLDFALDQVWVVVHQIFDIAIV
jgi:hypothetical protein